MFGFKRDIPAKCPVSDDHKQYLDKMVDFLLDIFKEDRPLEKKILIPHFQDFPVIYDHSEASAHATLAIVAQQMNIDNNEILLEFFDKEEREIETGSMWGRSTIYIASENNSTGPAGLYWGKQEDGHYHVSLERSKLKNPEGMVATLAHELAHIKLLGEDRMDQNDEKLTDLTTLIFGLGIFNANEAFKTSWGGAWSSLGYLSQMEWGYALALFAAARKETSPDWINHLSINVKTDFLMSEKFLQLQQQEP